PGRRSRPTCRRACPGRSPTPTHQTTTRAHATSACSTCCTATATWSACRCRNSATPCFTPRNNKAACGFACEWLSQNVKKMNWFSVTIRHGAESIPFVGASNETLESLAQRLQNSQIIRLEQMVYINEAQEVQDWEDWDHRVILLCSSIRRRY